MQMKERNMSNHIKKKDYSVLLASDIIEKTD